jgi:hypothetical protein
MPTAPNLSHSLPPPSPHAPTHTKHSQLRRKTAPVRLAFRVPQFAVTLHEGHVCALTCTTQTTTTGERWAGRGGNGGKEGKRKKMKTSECNTSGRSRADTTLWPRCSDTCNEHPQPATHSGQSAAEAPAATSLLRVCGCCSCAAGCEETEARQRCPHLQRRKSRKQHDEEQSWNRPIAAHLQLQKQTCQRCSLEVTARHGPAGTTQSPGKAEALGPADPSPQLTSFARPWGARGKRKEKKEEKNQSKQQNTTTEDLCTHVVSCGLGYVPCVR